MKAFNSSMGRRFARYMMSLMWLVSGLLPLHPQTAKLAYENLSLLNVPSSWHENLLYLGMGVDLIAAFLCIAFDRKITWYSQILIVMSYTSILTFSNPDLWLDPFGSLLKNLPIVALIICLACTTPSSK